MKNFDRVYIDMDGVLSDFDERFKQLFGKTPHGVEEDIGQARFWEMVYSVPDFFSSMPEMSFARQLMSICTKYSRECPMILSSPSKYNESLCVAQKRKWVDTVFGVDTPAIFISEKFEFAGPNRLLIDDTKKKIDAWEIAGGVGHLYTDYQKCVDFILDYTNGRR